MVHDSENELFLFASINLLLIVFFQILRLESPNKHLPHIFNLILNERIQFPPLVVSRTSCLKVEAEVEGRI
jgi:hypothetical protein